MVFIFFLDEYINNEFEPISEFNEEADEENLNITLDNNWYRIKMHVPRYVNHTFLF